MMSGGPGSFGMMLLGLATAATDCDISGLGPSHQGPCLRSSCTLVGLTIDGFVPVARADFDQVVEVTLCRDGTCSAPVDVGTAFPTGKTVGNVFYNVFYEAFSVQAGGGSCFGIGPTRTADGACVFVNHDETAFPLNEGDTYDLTIVGKTSRMSFVAVKNQIAHYVETHPGGCEQPELVVCRYAEISF
jgi:hypothetical protein